MQDLVKDRWVQVVGAFVLLLLVLSIIGGRFDWVALIVLLSACFGWLLVNLGQQDCTVLNIPAEPAADPEDRNSWAAVAIEAPGNGEAMLATIWDTVEEDKFRILTGPKSGKVAVIGRNSARVVGLFRQNDREHQEVLK